MKDQWIQERLKWANRKVRAYCGPNFWFAWNKNEERFEFWEKRGPMWQMIFPVDLNGRPLPDITEWEIEYAVKFVRRRRSAAAEERYYKHKEYNKWLKPDEYKDQSPKEDLSKWKNTSPYPEKFRKSRKDLGGVSV